MPNPSFHLFQLQKIDLRIDQINTRVNKITDLIQNNPALQEVDKSVKQSESEVSRVEQEIKDLEDQTRQKIIKIEQSESSLYKGANLSPKELADLQKEIASLKRAQSTLEDEQFNKLSEFEKFNEELLSKKQIYAKLLDEWKISNQVFDVELLTLNKEKEKLATERQMVTGQLQSEPLAVYEKLRAAKNHIAITTIEDESCAICGSEISAANIQKAKSSLILTLCPSCGRIIYSG